MGAENAALEPEQKNNRRGSITIEPGMKFGSLTVTSKAPSKNKKKHWNCVCDCGNECVVSETHLKTGHTKSCGCLAQIARRKKAVDIAGKRFGRLTAMEPTSARSNGSVVWRCSCDCGRDALCTVDNLVRGKVKSCGCLQEEQRKKNMEKAIHFVDGTCVERIACQRENAANTTGHRGVYRCKNDKWRASIEFRGKRYNLGTFHTYEEAVVARLESEKMYQEFLNDYYACR